MSSPNKAVNPSRDLVMAANQETTREWWANRSDAFELYVSQTVIKESSAGDQDAAQRRLEFLKPFPRLDITEEMLEQGDQDA